MGQTTSGAQRSGTCPLAASAFKINDISTLEARTEKTLVFKMTAMVGLMGTDHIFKTPCAIGYEIIDKNCHALFWALGLQEIS